MPPRPPLRLAVALAASLAAIAASPARAGGKEPRCSIPRADAWREYRSAHFAIASDVPRERAAKLVRELEEQHALVVAALFGEGVDVPGRLRVVAFSDWGRFSAHAPEHAAAYVTTDALGELAAVIPYDGREPVAELIAHELAHRVSFFHFPRQPAWFGEGLALFVGSVARERKEDRTPKLGSHIVRGVRGSGGRWAGLATPELLQRVSQSLDVGAAELLAWRGRLDDASPGRFHAASWVLYHWLWNHRSKQFTDYQERLSGGASPDAAWRAAFPEWDPARPETLASLDAALSAYRKQGRYAPYPVNVAAVDASFTEASLARAELHAVLLGVRARWPGDAAERKALRAAELDEALREDASHPLAVWQRAREREEPLVPALRAAAAARPDDFRAWLLLGGALDARHDAAEKEAALRKAVALQPESARANNELAWQLVVTHRAREARPFADRALDLAPWNPAIVDTLAAVAMEIGQCKAAVTLEARAADLFAADDPVGDGYRARLAEYEARCGAGAQPAAAPASAPR